MSDVGETAGAERQLASGLVRLSFLVQREYLRVSRAYDLTPQQAQLLCVLLGGPVGMAELGCSLNLEKSSITGLIDRAVRRGVVTRARDARDRRAYQVVLTAQGAELAARFHDHVSSAMESLAAGLDLGVQRQLTSAINHILTGQAVSAIFIDPPEEDRTEEDRAGESRAGSG
jgi:DNA-binding MarR family transcriptional regulator